MMMEDPKTLWVYIFGLAGLMLVSILFTGKIEPNVISTKEACPSCAAANFIISADGIGASPGGRWHLAAKAS